MSSLALAIPTNLVILCVPPAPGMIPNLASGSDMIVPEPIIRQHPYLPVCNWAWSDTPPTLKSHPRAISVPPPRAYPSTTPILGTFTPSSSEIKERSESRKFETCVGDIVRLSRRSAPAQNVPGCGVWSSSRRALGKSQLRSPRPHGYRSAVGRSYEFVDVSLAMASLISYRPDQRMPISGFAET